MKIRIFSVILCSCFVLQYSFAGSVYLSTSGNDGNSGKSSGLAVKTVSRALSLLLNGDTLLLRRGDVFRDSINVSLSGLTGIHIMAYGSSTSPKPVVSGSEVLTGWTLWKNNIYTAQATNLITELFVDDKRMTNARFPNSGWLPVTSSKVYSTSTELTSAPLAANPRDANNYWVGAKCHWHRWSWWDEVRDVLLAYKGGKITVKYTTSNSTDRPLAGWGFYLDNKLEELDSVGEWYQDKTTKMVYLRSPKDDNPGSHLVEGGALTLGVSINNSYIKDIAFRHQTYDGLEIDDSCVVENCSFENIFFRAIHARTNAHGCIIRNNEFYDNNNICINWYAKSNGKNALIEYNTFKRTAVVPANQNRLYGYDNGKTDKYESWWPFNAHASDIVVWYGMNNKIRCNRFDSTGYIPISLHANKTLVEYNFINHAMLNLNDGAGIYMDCGNSVVRNNIILNVQGSIKAAGASFGVIFAHGIWPEFIFDFRYNVVENNTAAGCGGFGMFLSSELYDTVCNNTFYNNKRSQFDLTGDAAKGTLQGHLVTNNILFGVGRSQPAITFNTNFNYGSLQNNYILNPGSFTEINTNLSAEQWSLMYPWIKGGNHFDSIKVPEYRTYSKGVEIITDPGFSSGVSQWVQDSKSAAVTITQATDQPKLTGQCMKLSFNSGNVIVDYQPLVSIDELKFYELRFDYIFQDLPSSPTSTSPSSFTVSIQDEQTKAMLGFYNFPATKLKRNAWMVFPSKGTSSSIRIQIMYYSSITNAMWIDNATLKPVKAQVRTMANESRLLYNDSMKVRSIPVGEGKWRDIYGKTVGSTVTLDPFRSVILIRNEEDSLGGVPEAVVPTALSPSGKVIPGSISIYPNPVTSQVSVAGILVPAEIQIINSAGIIIRNLNCTAETIIIDMETVAAGLYYIIVRDNQGGLSSGKVIKL